MKYIIQTKQKNYLHGLEHNSINEVMDAIVFYDLLPPFKIFDEKKNDVTNDIISKITKTGYKFIDKKKVAENIPANLQELMNKYYKNTVTLSFLNNLSVKLITVKDIKSIKGFYELWDKESITIGTSGQKILFYELNSNNICIISFSSIKNMTKKIVVAKTVDEFVKSFKANV